MMTELVVAPSQPTTSARVLVDLSRAHLAERKLEHPVRTVALEILADGEAVAETLELFPRDLEAAQPAQIDVAIARLRAGFGAEAVFGAELADQHRPEAAWAKQPFAAAAIMPNPRRKAKKELPRILPIVARGGVAALRLLSPPTVVEAEGSPPGEDPPRPPRALELYGVRRQVVEASGPTRLEGEWWTDEPLGRDYFEVATDDGGRYWLYRDHADGRFYLHGVFD